MPRGRKTIKKEDAEVVKSPVEPVNEIIEDVETSVEESNIEEIAETTTVSTDVEITQELPVEPEYSELGPSVTMNCNVSHDNKDYEAGKTYELDRKTIALFLEKGFLTI